MKRYSIAAAAALCVAVGTVQAAQILPIAGSGVAQPSGYLPISNNFSNQPTWDGTQPVSSSTDTSSMGFYNSRYAYVDFGASYTDIQITQTWTRYRQYSGGDCTIWLGGYWTNTNPATTNTTTSNTIGDVGFKLESATALPYVANAYPVAGGEPWVMDTDLTAAPVTPGGRYLVLQQIAAGGQGRGEEYAFVGTIGATPEPVSLGLLGLGGLALMGRRRR